MKVLEELLYATGLWNFELGQVIMMLVCLGLIYLAIAKEFEPLLLLPIGFGGILANIPVADIGGPSGFLGIIYHMGVSNGLFPLLIFMILCIKRYLKQSKALSTKVCLLIPLP